MTKIRRLPNYLKQKSKLTCGLFHDDGAIITKNGLKTKTKQIY